MKAYIKSVEPAPPPPKVVVLEMSEKEAEILYCLVGGIQTRSSISAASSTILNLYEWLRDVTPSYEKSFSDFFVGDVEVR